MEEDTNYADYDGKLVHSSHTLQVLKSNRSSRAGASLVCFNINADIFETHSQK